MILFCVFVLQVKSSPSKDSISEQRSRRTSSRSPSQKSKDPEKSLDAMTPKFPHRKAPKILDSSPRVTRRSAQGQSRDSEASILSTTKASTKKKNSRRKESADHVNAVEGAGTLEIFISR